MLNKDIQQVRIDVVEVLIATCKDNPNSMYEAAERYLTILKDSLEEHKEFYEQEYRG